MKRVHKNNRQGKKRSSKKRIKIVSQETYRGMELHGRMELIQALIPLGLSLIEEELIREIQALAGVYYERKDRGATPIYRHGSNPGSVHLGGQRIPIDVPRLRRNGEEIALKSYELAHRGTTMNDDVFRKVLLGISCGDYEQVARKIPEAFGLSRSTVSNAFIKASQLKVEELAKRDLSKLDIVAILVDGKYFSDDEVVTAVGVSMDGTKHILGLVHTGSENSTVLHSFFKELISRGLSADKGLLIVVDGAKGMLSAAKKVFKRRGFLQRCQWHKRENIVSYLPKSEQASMRKRLQRAYERPTYDEAKKELMSIHAELEERNQNAAGSLMEGFEETLTLHRLGLFAILGRSLKTTNAIESIHSHIQRRCGRISCWKNSNQLLRWIASTVLEIEPRLRKIQNYKHLSKLRNAMLDELGNTSIDDAEQLEIAA